MKAQKVVKEATEIELSFKETNLIVHSLELALDFMGKCEDDISTEIEALADLRELLE